MNLVSWLQRLMTNFGAGWVMWLLVVLSVLSVAVMLERAWFYWSLRDDLAKLAHDLRERLRANDLEGAKKRMESSPSAEAAVVTAGLLEADRGAEAAEQAMQGAQALQRIKLERRLAFLGTLGNNAPFIGLFGTVIGIIIAFNGLSQAATASIQAVAPGIADALIATAAGIAAAVPAVLAYNHYVNQIKVMTAEMDSFTLRLLNFIEREAGG